MSGQSLSPEELGRRPLEADHCVHDWREHDGEAQEVGDLNQKLRQGERQAGVVACAGMTSVSLITPCGWQLPAADN